MKTNYVLWALGNLMDTPPFVICDANDYDAIDWCDIPESQRPSKQDVLAEIEKIKTVIEPLNKAAYSEPDIASGTMMM